MEFSEQAFRVEKYVCGKQKRRAQFKENDKLKINLFYSVP